MDLEADRLRQRRDGLRAAVDVGGHDLAPRRTGPAAAPARPPAPSRRRPAAARVVAFPRRLRSGAAMAHDEHGPGRHRAVGEPLEDDPVAVAGQDRGRTVERQPAEVVDLVVRGERAGVGPHRPPVDDLQPLDPGHALDVARLAQRAADADPVTRFLQDLPHGALDLRLARRQLALGQAPVVVARPMDDGDLHPRSRPRFARRPSAGRHRTPPAARMIERAHRFIQRRRLVRWSCAHARPRRRRSRRASWLSRSMTRPAANTRPRSSSCAAAAAWACVGGHHRVLVAAQQVLELARARRRTVGRPSRGRQAGPRAAASAAYRARLAPIRTRWSSASVDSAGQPTGRLDARGGARRHCRQRRQDDPGRGSCPSALSSGSRASTTSRSRSWAYRSERSSSRSAARAAPWR